MIINSTYNIINYKCLHVYETQNVCFVKYNKIKKMKFSLLLKLLSMIFTLHTQRLELSMRIDMFLMII